MISITVERLKTIRRRYKERRFMSQGTRRIQCGRFEIDAPKNHLLAHILKKQPLRDRCLGLAAAHVSKKYPDSTFLDIGANIGDTAAVMATYARNRLVLVEPSDYFFSILSRNVTQLPNETILVNSLISDGTPISGGLHHWAGTASISTAPGHMSRMETKRLSDVAPNSTRLVKIDTDGFDFKIITASLDWFKATRAALMLEDQIRTYGDLREANETFSHLRKIGYGFFIAWDDPGLHVLSTTSIEIIHDLNRYLFQLWNRDARKSIHNFDVLCLHQTDADIYEAISAQCRT